MPIPPINTSKLMESIANHPFFQWLTEEMVPPISDLGYRPVEDDPIEDLYNLTVPKARWEIGLEAITPPGAVAGKNIIKKGAKKSTKALNEFLTGQKAVTDKTRGLMMHKPDKVTGEVVPLLSASEREAERMLPIRERNVAARERLDKELEGMTPKQKDQYWSARSKEKMAARTPDPRKPVTEDLGEWGDFERELEVLRDKEAYYSDLAKSLEDVEAAGDTVSAYKRGVLHGDLPTTTPKAAYDPAGPPGRGWALKRTNVITESEFNNRYAFHGRGIGHPSFSDDTISGGLVSGDRYSTARDFSGSVRGESGEILVVDRQKLHPLVEKELQDNGGRVDSILPDLSPSAVRRVPNSADNPYDWLLENDPDFLKPSKPAIKTTKNQPTQQFGVGATGWQRGATPGIGGAPFEAHPERAIADIPARQDPITISRNPDNLTAQQARYLAEKNHKDALAYAEDLDWMKSHGTYRGAVKAYNDVRDIPLEYAPSVGKRGERTQARQGIQNPHWFGIGPPGEGHLRARDYRRQARESGELYSDAGPGKLPYEEKDPLMPLARGSTPEGIPLSGAPKPENRVIHEGGLQPTREEALRIAREQLEVKQSEFITARELTPTYLQGEFDKAIAQGQKNIDDIRAAEFGEIVEEIAEEGEALTELGEDAPWNPFQKRKD